MSGVRGIFFATVLWASGLWPAVASAQTADYQTVVRPLLAQHCWKCHGAAEQEAGLRLDQRDAAVAPLPSGHHAVVPGDAAESALMQRIASADPAERMPPEGQPPLAPQQIEALKQWIAAGAPYSEHWAYAPLTAAPLPTIRHSEWPQGWPDALVLARLEAAGLSPSHAAPGAALVRRLHFDLTGLPPDELELAAALADSRPEAWPQWVDRLLASPQFGQRQARRWLDVVRFAESVTLRGLVLNEAWRYRDYVIDSFNADLPYDRFLREQVAGDLLPFDSVDQGQRQLAATMFWALGNINLEEQDKRQLDMDVVDEQLDVLGKAVLGQTIGCARCHDHKFDPIATRDYYALAGILRNTQLLDHANVSTWRRVPLPLPAEQEAAQAAAEGALAALERQRDGAREGVNRLSETLEGTAAVAPGDLPGIVVDDAQAKAVGKWQASRHSGRYIGAGFVHDMRAGQGAKTLTFVPALPADGRYEVRLAYVAHENRATNAQVTVFSAEGERTLSIDMRQPPAIDRRFVSLGEYRFERAGQSFVLVANEGANGHVAADAVQFLPRDGALADQPSSQQPAADATNPDRTQALAAARQELARLEAELKRAKQALPRRPAVLTLVERKEISDAPVHIRGSVHTLGEVVPRGVLPVAAAGTAAVMPADQSGRRELAAWLTAADNPLTARVIANRVWGWLLGRGLSATVDNFGATGEAPTHPELLDRLARELIDDDWSIKRLVRRIVLSETYRQASFVTPQHGRIDPENRLWSRAERRRLEAECLRDALLCVGGQLDQAMGGATLPADLASDYGHQSTHTRRSVYVPALRNSLPALFEAFDFPDTSLTVGQRGASVIAPQALSMLNDPLVNEQAAAAAQRLLAETPLADTPRRIEVAFARCLGRMPTAAERAVAEQVVSASDATDEALGAWTDLFHLLFASVDFRFLD